MKVLRIVARTRPTMLAENLKAFRQLELLPPKFQQAVRNVIDVGVRTHYEANGIPIPSEAKNIGKPVITIDGDDRPGA